MPRTKKNRNTPPKQKTHEVTYKIVWIYCTQHGGSLPIPVGDNYVTISVPDAARARRRSGDSCEIGEVSFWLGNDWADFTCLYDFATGLSTDFRICHADPDINAETGIPYAIGEGLYPKLEPWIDLDADDVRGAIELRTCEVAGADEDDGGDPDGDDGEGDPAQKVFVDDNGSQILFLKLRVGGGTDMVKTMYCKQVVEGRDTVLTDGEKKRLNLPLEAAALRPSDTT